MLEEAVRAEKKHFDSSDFRIRTSISSNMSMKKIDKPQALEGKSKKYRQPFDSTESESERVIPPRESTTKKKKMISTEVQPHNVLQ